VFEPFSSSYDDIEAKEALVEFLKIEGKTTWSMDLGR
jgi:hypothetical protein